MNKDISHEPASKEITVVISGDALLQVESLQKAFNLGTPAQVIERGITALEMIKDHQESHEHNVPTS